MNGCEIVADIPLPGTVLPAGLGYDSLRDLFILTDASFNVVFQVTTSGRIVSTWPTPGPGPVGAAYDSRRDLYWISDWEEDRIYSVDPKTGLPGPAIELPAGSRISGAAYDANLDALAYHSRDEVVSYWMSVETAELLAIFEIPRGGRNNGNGSAIDPADGNLWLTHFEEATSFCLRGLSNGMDEPRDHDGFRRDSRDAGHPATAPVLHAASPNPFNPVTRIRYTLPREGFTILNVYDVRGRFVEALVSENRPQGEHVVEWSANNLASGIYFYRLTVGQFSETRKVILLK
jgi:hypothetical protein